MEPALLLQLQELQKLFRICIYLIVPFQYVLRYQLVLNTCLNFLPCCLDNSRYLIGSQKPIRQKSSTCLNYQVTRENSQWICKNKTICACGIKHSLVRTTIANEMETGLEINFKSKFPEQFIFT